MFLFVSRSDSSLLHDRKHYVNIHSPHWCLYSEALLSRALSAQLTSCPSELSVMNTRASLLLTNIKNITFYLPLTSILVSNLMTESGMKWILSAAFPPLGSTPSYGLTTMPGRGQTSSTCLEQTAMDSREIWYLSVQKQDDVCMCVWDRERGGTR